MTHRALRALALFYALPGWAGAQSKWIEISTPVVQKLKEENRKIDWPGETAGVAVDSATGDVFMVVPGQGIWKSADQGRSFARADDGTIGGRCETSYSLEFDPSGHRLACFMLDGKCGMTLDGGKTWAAFTGIGRNWDYAAVDWSGGSVNNIFGARHECGGEVFLSNDSGKTWNKLFADPEFERSGGLGIFDEKTLVYTMKGKGIQRSTDQGKTWSKVSDSEPWGRVVRVSGKAAYWLGKEGLLVSKDRGATWARQGSPVEGTIGPFFDPKNAKRMAAAGSKGLFVTIDGGASWKLVAPLPEKFSMPKAGWYANVDWDAGRGVFYASQMGKATYKLDARN